MSLPPGSAVELVAAIQRLSLARDLETVMAIVRHSARSLTGADGATFILRDDNLCFYADEDAIEPLWKGQRFPLQNCISGWAIQHREPVIVEDIYQDPRIPLDAYRPTFVKSLAIVPIRTEAPIGAVGNYWAQRHRASPEEIGVLQALANSASIALENVELYSKLEQRVRDRTAELEVAYREMEAFSYSAAHDLRAPITLIRGWTETLADAVGSNPSPIVTEAVARVGQAAERMEQLVNDLLLLSRAQQAAINIQSTDLTEIARDVADGLRTREPGRQVEFAIAPGLRVDADPVLLRTVIENLLGNAWKFTRDAPEPRIVVGCQPGQEPVFFVSDNGAGFDVAEVGKLFFPFSRLQTEADFPGTGIGLSVVRRIIDRHGGRVWADGKQGEGATFFFTLPSTPRSD